MFQTLQLRVTQDLCNNIPRNNFKNEFVLLTFPHSRLCSVGDPQHRDTRKIPKIKINHFTSPIKWSAVRDLHYKFLTVPFDAHHVKLSWSWIFLKIREKIRLLHILTLTFFEYLSNYVHTNDFFIYSTKFRSKVFSFSLQVHRHYITHLHYTRTQSSFSKGPPSIPQYKVQVLQYM